MVNNIKKIFLLILVISITITIVSCKNEQEHSGGIDTVVAPTAAPNANGVLCPKCGEEKCDVYSKGDINGYRCRACFTKFGYFEPTTVEVMTDNNGFYLVKNGDLCDVMFSTYYWKDDDHFITPGIRSYDLEREEDHGVLVFNSTKGWAALTIEKTEDGVISGKAEINFEKTEMDIGDAICKNVSSSEITNGLNLFGENGVSVISDVMKIDTKYMTCEGGNIKLNFSSLTNNSNFQNLYIQNPVVISATLDDEFSYANGADMYVISGHDNNIYVTIGILPNQVIHGEDESYRFINVSINAISNISGEKFVLENQEMLYKVDNK